MPQPFTRDGWISLIIPDGWQLGEEDGVLTLIRTSNGRGALQVSFATYADRLADVEAHAIDTLRTFAQRQEGRETSLRAFRPEGLQDTLAAHTSVITAEDYWEAWFVTDGIHRVLITYNCDLLDRGVEQAAYGEILQSISFRWAADLKLLGSLWYWDPV